MRLDALRRALDHAQLRLQRLVRARARVRVRVRVTVKVRVRVRG